MHLVIDTGCAIVEVAREIGVGEHLLPLGAIEWCQVDHPSNSVVTLVAITSPLHRRQNPSDSRQLVARSVTSDVITTLL